MYTCTFTCTCRCRCTCTCICYTCTWYILVLIGIHVHVYCTLSNKSRLQYSCNLNDLESKRKDDKTKICHKHVVRTRHIIVLQTQCLLV